MLGNGDVIDWLLGWGGAVILIAVVFSAVRSQNKTILALALVLCLGIVAFREVAITAVARAKITTRIARGTLSNDYRDGILDMERFTTASGRHTLLATLGITAIAVALFNRKSRRKPD